MKNHVFLRFVFVFLLIFSLFSCVSTAALDSAKNQFSSGMYENALGTLENQKEEIYTKKDDVLYGSDTGVLNHYIGEYSESNKKLANSERLIEYYQSKSFGQAIASFLVNDKSIDYAGEEYEDIYANLFMALNYIHLGKTEDAFVEIRRFDNKQKALSVKYSKEIADSKNDKFDTKVSFNNSALARYISLLLYRSENKLDSATVDQKLIDEAFKTQKQLYPFAVPSSIKEEFTIPSDMGRLNFISFVGQAPIKEQELIYIDDSDGIPLYALALPYMTKQGTKVSSIGVTIYDTFGNACYSNLDKIESIENIAEDTFKQKRGLIYAKAIARSVGKAISSSIVVGMEKSYEEEHGNPSLGLSLFSLLVRGSNILTEQADLRTSQFFPAEAYIGGVNLKPGVYVVEVKYMNKNGRVLDIQTFSDVKVQKNQLNLVESLCVR